MKEPVNMEGNITDLCSEKDPMGDSTCTATTTDNDTSTATSTDNSTSIEGTHDIGGQVDDCCY